MVGKSGFHLRMDVSGYRLLDEDTLISNSLVLVVRWEGELLFLPHPAYGFPSGSVTGSQLQKFKPAKGHLILAWIFVAQIRRLSEKCPVGFYINRMLD